LENEVPYAASETDRTWGKKPTGRRMLVKVMEMEMLINLLLAVEWGR
jgi:hypothetical protein